MGSEHIEMTLRWRVQPEVTRYMLSDIVYDLENQKKWFEKVSNDPTMKYWVISYNGKPVGVFNLADLDIQNQCCSVGYYIGDPEYRAIGFFIPPYLYNYVFSKYGLQKITGEVLDGNINVMKMHEMHGWRKIKILKDKILKYDQLHDVHICELLASKWESMKQKYGRFLAHFDEIS